MTNFSCCVKVEFDSAHRILGYPGKCNNLHGHRYCLEVTVVSDKLDHLGMVVDFGFLKTTIKNWIDEHFDHTVILWQEDKALGESIANITKQKIYYMPYNPTAENMALYLKNNIFSKILSSKDFKVSCIKLQETSNCYAMI